MGPDVDVFDASLTSPVVIHVPHASRNVPPWARDGLTLSDDRLVEELDAMTDAHTDLIVRTANEIGDAAATLFINQLSRFVVDPERFPDEREEMLAVGMGAVYTQGHDGRTLRDETDLQTPAELIKRVFQPYAQRLSNVVERTLAQHGRVTIIDVHSFPREPSPYELHADLPRPEICLGVDEFHTSSQLRSRAEEAFDAFAVGENTPFAGTYVPLTFYRSEPRVQSIMIEIRRDLYLESDLSPQMVQTERLARALADLVSGESDPV